MLLLEILLLLANHLTWELLLVGLVMLLHVLELLDLGLHHHKLDGLLFRCLVLVDLAHLKSLLVLLEGDVRLLGEHEKMLLLLLLIIVAHELRP